MSEPDNYIRAETGRLFGITIKPGPEDLRALLKHAKVIMTWPDGRYIAVIQ